MCNIYDIVYHCCPVSHEWGLIMQCNQIWTMTCHDLFSHTNSTPSSARHCNMMIISLSVWCLPVWGMRLHQCHWFGLHSWSWKHCRRNISFNDLWQDWRLRTWSISWSNKALNHDPHNFHLKPGMSINWYQIALNMICFCVSAIRCCWQNQFLFQGNLQLLFKSEWSEDALKLLN